VWHYNLPTHLSHGEFQISVTRSYRLGSLSISLPGGQTILAAAAILALILGACEVGARIEPVRAGLVTPVVSGQEQIAAKLDLLDTMARQGPIDCVFVGSSMVLQDINPEVVSQASAGDGGGGLRCFNFGLSGLNVEGAARLSKILIARVHPRIIVYGTNFRDFADAFGFGMDIPWARYQLGQPSFDGWLETTSVSYRYALAYTRLDELSRSNQYGQPFSAAGYLATDDVLDVSEPPNRAANKKHYDAMKDYHISEEARQSLRSLIGLNSTGASIVIVEMPVPTSTLNFLGNPEQDYQHFADVVTQETAAQSVPFWLTLKAGMIPADGWSDYTHMNRAGGAVFSDWLGHQLAALAS
jgi:hypothetical protein